MRTTIEIPDEQRARLLDLAARRGQKGFSRLVQEAIDLYLRELENREEVIQEAVDVLGTFDDNAADHLLETSRDIRSSWR